MDKIGGWYEEGRTEGDERCDGSQIGGRLAVHMDLF